jgi:hypothetical protein|tara:strand:+ start:1564 stop:2211 length:648 start_codon:yes stop_codon:yes gene_type:complete
MAIPRPTDDYSWSDPSAGLESAEQDRQKSMGRLRGTVSAARAYRESERKRIDREYKRAERKRKAAMEAERKKRASNWSNWAAMGAGIGSMFTPIGMPLGAGIGSLVGIGKSLASGGNPLDLGAQFKYLDPGMVSQAAMMHAYNKPTEDVDPGDGGGGGDDSYPWLQLGGAGATGELGYNQQGSYSPLVGRLDMQLNDPRSIAARKARQQALNANV